MDPIDILPFLAFGIALLAWFAVLAQATRVSRLERQLDRIVRGLDIYVAGMLNLSDRVKELAADPTRKLEAIRAYREETGCGLAEAKDAVELYLASRKP